MKNKLSVFSIDSDISEQMLSSREILYYVNKFKNKLFFIFLQEKNDFFELEEDLELLRASGLNCLVFAPSFSESDANTFNYKYLDNKNTISKNLSGFNIFSYKNNFINRLKVFKIMLEISINFDVEKIFILSEWKGISYKKKYFSNLTYSEFFGLNITETNIPNSYFKLISLYRDEYKGDIVVLGNKRGSIYQETFTHKGSGTLVTDKLEEGIRKAKESEVSDILFLLYPHFKNKSILSISRNEIFKNLDNFYVYHCNNRIVSAACLKSYGDYYELSKICSLPRYQGKRRAFELVKHVLIQAFQNNNIKAVFSLSNVDKMHDFFMQFNFKEVLKTELPDQWKLQYDMTRESKAFMLNRSN